MATLRPGLGKSAEDRVLIYVEKGDSVVRRVRFTLDGLETTRGAIVDVDMANYVRIEGVRWPTTFFERVRRPIPISAHRWTLTGLDVNRDYTEAEISGAAFRGSALPVATPISPTANY